METKTFTGRVTAVGVKGVGPKSAQLLFSITPAQGAPKSFVALSPVSALAHEDVALGHEPQVFGGMTTILMAMYGKDQQVLIEYISTAATDGTTDVVVHVQVPAA